MSSNWKVGCLSDSHRSCVQDFLTSAYLITSKDTFYSREQFAQLVAYMGDGALL